ncbi:alpha/beta fold hydrolase [Edaphobacter aggregans]|uniref:alpha/beta fold hydrolase n=1 Tax=Edaphobacter aggregans TaxID=570835 RepID=UPI000551784D|nr:alpha/beta fold hydrolase [Edaphobacter aggregans]
MNRTTQLRKLATLAAILTLSLSAPAQTMSAPTGQAPRPATKWPAKDNVYVIKNFRFGTGETLPELTLHYLTLGEPHRNAAGHVDNAILLLHGTGGNRHTLMVPQFSDVLFGPGQPFDITKYFLILPDDIGQGDSSKPSDGVHMKFPQYDYDDMVRSQYLMLTEGMNVDHLRLILGTSMGCMQSWVWGEAYPTFMDALAPFACYPTELAGRNRMTRYIAMESIKHDPNWKNGEYTTEPIEGLRGAEAMLLVMGSAPLQMQKNYPTRAQAEKYVDDYMARTIPATDANNLLYYVNASRNYNPEPKLSTIVAPALWINSADDVINPPELGEKIINPRVLPKMPKTKFILIPISDATRGHGTHTQAAVWKDYLIKFMAETEPK